MYGRIGGPGQREEFQAGVAQDLTLPQQQADAMQEEMYWGLAWVSLAGLAVGRWMLAAGLIYLGARASAWLLEFSAPRRDGEHGPEIDEKAPQYQRALFVAAVPVVVTLALAPVVSVSLWPFGWAAESLSSQWHVLKIELIGAAFAVPAVLRLVGLSVAGVGLWRCGLLSWRYSYEIVDPTYPAPRAVDPRQIGPRWPWLRFLEHESAAPEVGYPREPERQSDDVLRFIPVSGTKPRRVSLRAPSGRVVPVDLLRRFLAEGQADGFSERVWGKKGVGREAWEDCSAILESVGILQRRPNQPAVLLVSTDEAERMLSQALM